MPVIRTYIATPKDVLISGTHCIYAGHSQRYFKQFNRSLPQIQLNINKWKYRNFRNNIPVHLETNNKSDNQFTWLHTSTVVMNLFQFINKQFFLSDCGDKIQVRFYIYYRSIRKVSEFFRIRCVTYCERSR